MALRSEEIVIEKDEKHMKENGVGLVTHNAREESRLHKMQC